jgi:hypothetical protein
MEDEPDVVEVPFDSGIAVVDVGEASCDRASTTEAIFSATVLERSSGLITLSRV